MKTHIFFVFLAFLAAIILPGQTQAQFPGFTPPFHQGGGIDMNVELPEACSQMESVLSQISPNGVLGVITETGTLSSAEIGNLFGDAMGIAGDIGLNLAAPGLGSIFGGMLSGLFGGGDDGTKKAVEELTRVQMTALVEAECQSILQDLFLTILGSEEVDKIDNSDYNQQDVRENIRRIEVARDNLGYLRAYLADEYKLLYDTWNRHKEYEKNPEYWQEIRDQYADYNIHQADKLIISSRENQRMTGDSHEYLDILTGMLSREDLTPVQAQQLQGYISALHAQELTEAKHILAGQAAFIASLEVERRERQRDEVFYQRMWQESTSSSIDQMHNDSENTPPRRIVPSWAGSQ